MALSQDQVAQLQQVLESGDDITEDTVVDVLNANLDNNEFVRQSALDASDVPDSFFKRFNPSDIVTNRRQVITQGVWSEGEGTLRYDTMNSFTAQTNEESGDYFWEVYDVDPSNELEGSRIQFYVGYGNKAGGGSAQITTSQPNALEASKAVYSQQKNALVPPAQIRDDVFASQGSTVGPDSNPTAVIGGTDSFYVINIARARYKQTFDPGNWELRLLFPGASDDDFAEGAGGYQGPNQDAGAAQGRYQTADDGLPSNAAGNYSVLKLVDEVATTDFANEQLTTGQVGRKIPVLSGSLNLDRTGTATPDVVDPEEYSQIGDIPQQPYGYFYPDAGIILLDPKMLQYHALYINRDGPARNISANTDPEQIGDEFEYEDLSTALSDDDFLEDEAAVQAAVGDPARDPLPRLEQIQPVTALDGEYQNHALLYRAAKRGGYFTGRSAEEIISTTLFVRARNRDFNFSNNPTFVNRSDGRIRNEEFIGNPRVYITTVGLYDDENNLVAVAKLSNPQIKDFQNEALIRVTLDY